MDYRKLLEALQAGYGNIKKDVDAYQKEQMDTGMSLGQALGLNQEQAKSFAETGMQLGEQTMGGVKSIKPSTAEMLKNALEAKYGRVITPDVKVPKSEMGQVRAQLGKIKSEGGQLPDIKDIAPKEPVPVLEQPKIPEYNVPGVLDEEVHQARQLYDSMDKDKMGELAGADNLEKLMRVLGKK